MEAARSIGQPTGMMTDAEASARIDLAACCRLAAHFGWEDLIYTHITVRLPDREDQFLINPFGVYFGEITASSLVKVDLDGTVIGDSAYGINPSGFVIHGAIHEARSDAGCVMHTHTIAGGAVSAQLAGLLPITQHALYFYENVGYHDYEGIALELDERRRLIANLADRDALILRNHGLLTVGETVKAAFVRMYVLQRACEMQIAAQRGGELVTPPEEACRKVGRQIAEFAEMGALEWPGLLRMLDRECPEFRS